MSEYVATLFMMLKKAGVPAELHIYSSGGHGFGIWKRVASNRGMADEIARVVGRSSVLAKTVAETSKASAMI